VRAGAARGGDPSSRNAVLDPTPSAPADPRCRRRRGQRQGGRTRGRHTTFGEIIWSRLTKLSRIIVDHLIDDCGRAVPAGFRAWPSSRPAKDLELAPLEGCPDHPSVLMAHCRAQGRRWTAILSRRVGWVRSRDSAVLGAWQWLLRGVGSRPRESLDRSHGLSLSGRGRSSSSRDFGMTTVAPRPRRGPVADDTSAPDP
jgi:hypothetical protein